MPPPTRPTLLVALAPALALIVAAASWHSTAGQEEGGERGLQHLGEGAYEGPTLFPPLRSTTTYLVDLDGDVVHTWESELFPGNSAYLLEDGTLLRCGRVENDLFGGGGQGGRLQLLGWNGEVLWDFGVSDERHMHHHDIEPLPNGNVLVIAWEHRSPEEAVAAGRDPARIGPRGFWPDYVAEIEPLLPDDGRVVWEWHVWDHLIQDLDETQDNFGDVTAHPELVDLNADHRDQPPLSAEERAEREELERQMRALGYVGEEEEANEPTPEPDDDRGRVPGDWLHTNSIDYHPELDLIVLSVHHLNEIWVIDHSTTTREAAGHEGGRWGHGGDLLARWGHPRTYGAGSEEDQRLFGQHDASFVEAPPGKLGILVFNNGRGRPGGDASSVDEIAFPFDSERGFLELPTDLFWTYRPREQDGFYSSFISGAQRLPNGNTLVCSGVNGRFLEVTRDGEGVWDYLNPFGQAPRESGRGPDRERGSDARGGPGGRRGPGGPGPKGLFRGTRLEKDHPGLRWGELKSAIRRSFPRVEQLPVRTLAKREAPPILLDARAPEEYAVSHLPGARRARTEKEALALLADVPREAEIVVYCSVGYRSSKLANQLLDAGFENVRNLEGSIFEWANAGHPVVRGGERVDEVHPYDDDWGRLLHPELWSSCRGR